MSKFIFLFLAFSLCLLPILSVYSSDAEDGERTEKARALNLTDLYVFKEGDQTGTTADNANLVMIMNVGPRSLPKTPYYFATGARYEFHVSRVANSNRNVRPTGSDDILVRFEFGNFDSTSQRQPMTVTVIKDNQTFVATATSSGSTLETTSLVDLKTGGASNFINNSFVLNGNTLRVFAGLRQDPSFYDAEQIFRWKGSLLGTYSGNIPEANAQNSGDPFKIGSTAVDVSKGYNINSIVLKAPIVFFQGDPSHTTFDTWASIFISD